MDDPVSTLWTVGVVTDQGLTLNEYAEEEARSMFDRARAQGIERVKTDRGVLAVILFNQNSYAVDEWIAPKKETYIDATPRGGREVRES